MWLAMLFACAPRLATEPCADRLDHPGAWTCPVPGWPDRDAVLVLPRGADGVTPLPVILNFHGGGGSPAAAARTTCPDGDPAHPGCLHGELADARRFVVVHPAGTRARLGSFRTWNAGGGRDGWRCVAGRACEEDVDDTRYVADLLDELARLTPIDPARVYAVGLSNGGAMGHRLACTLADRISGVVAVGGANQWATTHPCDPARPIPILQVHGTADPCWTFDGGPTDCPIGQDDLAHVAVPDSMAGWATRNGCSGDPTERHLPPSAADGLATTRLTWPGCAAPVELLRVEGGGHTWPDGFAWLGERTVGPVARSWGDEVLVDFLGL